MALENVNSWIASLFMIPRSGDGSVMPVVVRSDGIVGATIRRPPGNWGPNRNGNGYLIIEFDSPLDVTTDSMFVTGISQVDINTPDSFQKCIVDIAPYTGDGLPDGSTPGRTVKVLVQMSIQQGNNPPVIQDVPFWLNVYRAPNKGGNLDALIGG